jgi:hypothetical protein
MDCYRFLGAPLKVHYAMVIQKLSMKLSMKFIQCDCNIYNIIVLTPVSFYSIIFNHMANYKFQNLVKFSL